MAAKKTWIWIVVACLAAAVVALIAVAAAGVYFVAHHIQTERSSSADALEAFDVVTGSFGGRRPLYELDGSEQPRLARPLTDLPTSVREADALWILAWNPDDERLVRVSLPLWVLGVGRAKMELAGEHGFDLRRLELDGDELRRIGPALVFDFRSREGTRVLLWTQ